MKCHLSMLFLIFFLFIPQHPADSDFRSFSETGNRIESTGLDITCDMEDIPCPYPIPTDAVAPYGILDSDFRWKDIAANIYAESYRNSYTYDDAEITVVYETCGDSTMRGSLHADNLKPNFAYQMKLLGKPSVLWGDDGDDAANENIGFAGRWWRVQPNPGNADDADYLAHKDDPDYIYEGYLIFDFFISDSLGSADVLFETNSSYHVLFWQDQRPPGPNDSDVKWHTVIGHSGDPAYEADVGPVDVGVYAQIERRTPGATGLPVGSYNCRFLLTEESFHQTGPLEGTWGHALSYDHLLFEMTGNPVPSFYEIDVVDVGDTTSESGHNLEGWGPVEPETHGGHYGGIDDCRVMYASAGNGDGDDWATIDMDFGPSETTPKYLTFKHLEGIAQDAFDVYIYPQGNPDYAVMIFTYPGDGRTVETWYTKTITVVASGIQTIKFVSTGPLWSGFETYGQVAIDTVKVEACTAPLWYDYVDIGSGDQNELDHGIPDPGDWGPPEPETHGGNWGGIGNFEDSTCRVIWEPGSSEDHRVAYLTMDHGDSTCRKDLIFNVIEGIAQDAFDVYLDSIDESNHLYYYDGLQYTLETWVSHTIGYYATGQHTIWLRATPTDDDPWGGFDTFGKVAFRNAVLANDRRPRQSPIFEMDNPDWRIEAATFIQDGQPSGESFITTYNQGRNEWSFWADVLPTGTAGSVGFVFDYIDSANYAVAYIRDDGSQSIAIDRRTGSSWTPINSTPVTIVAYPIRMKIYKTADILTFDVGEYELSTTSCTDGLLGLWTNDLTAEFTDVCFIPTRPAVETNMSFIQRDGNHFTHLCKPFYFAGFNNYYQMVYAADDALKPHVDEVQEEAVLMGLTVMRTWAFNDGADEWNALQTSPGVYQEYVFEGLDYVLNKAYDTGLRVILVFVNNWNDYGGMDQYVEWSPTASVHDDFYTDSSCRQWYMNHIEAVLDRVNTLNGRVYKDDTTIFAWELANEPRCLSDSSGDTLQEWIETMSAFVKSIDSKHLVTSGSEGFYGNTGPDHNPVNWMYDQGVDFVRNHEPETIDFGVFHAWPDWWGMDYDQSMQWAVDHIQDTEDLLGKPVVMEEFGKQRPLSIRDQYYQGWYDAIYDGASAGLAAGGSLFWILYHDDYPDYDGFGVYYPDDASTINIIETEAGKMAGLME